MIKVFNCRFFSYVIIRFTGRKGTLTGEVVVIIFFGHLNLTRRVSHGLHRVSNGHKDNYGSKKLGANCIGRVPYSSTKFGCGVLLGNEDTGTHRVDSCVAS